MNLDFIGDIHGHAQELEALLRKLGYTEHLGAWRHPDRQAVFLGDFIDRGPEQLRSVELVRQMVDAGSALAVMGNHELNAIAWFLPDPKSPGEYLRPHLSERWGDRNRRQHERFLAEVDGKPALHAEIVRWFLSLPLWLELRDARVVHACWHERFREYLEPLLASGARLTEDRVEAVVREPEDEAEKDTPTPTPFKAVEALTKGIEVTLPSGHQFLDKDGHPRTRVRVRWWAKGATSFRDAANLSERERSQLPVLPIPEHAMLARGTAKPVFVGHYWLEGEPSLLAPDVACVDFSVAKRGRLVAYRFDGEQILSPEKLVSVPARDA